MARDINADKRWELDQAIRYKEQEVDNLSQAKQQAERQLNEARSRMNNDFMQSTELYDKMVRSGNRMAQNELTTNQTMKQALDFMIDRNQEEMESYYNKQRTQLFDEIENLQREKGALPWD